MFSIKHEGKTDVYGVYDRPPTEPDAILLKEIGEHQALVNFTLFMAYSILFI